MRMPLGGCRQKIAGGEMAGPDGGALKAREGGPGLGGGECRMFVMVSPIMGAS